MSALVDHVATTDSLRTPTSRSLVIGAAAAGAATLTNLIIYTAGRAADIGIAVRASDGPQSEITAVQVAAISLIAVIIGAFTVTLVGRRWNRGAPVVRAVGAMFAVVTVAGPVSLSAVDSSLKPLLAVMHLTCGLWFLYGTRPARPH